MAMTPTVWISKTIKKHDGDKPIEFFIMPKRVFPI
jgi:hypothetical protein